MAAGSVADSELLARISQKLGDHQLAKWIVDEAFRNRIRADSEIYALEMVDRYLRGEPIQYVFGHWSFRSLELKCDTRALIPRPETEQLVDLVKAEISAHPEIVKILEIGTGTGAISLALGSEVAGLKIIATELSALALELARENMEAQLGLVSEVVMLRSDLFDEVPESMLFDLIVSNPPYISSSALLDSRVVDHEPPEALFGGADGLLVIRRMIRDAPARLVGEGAQVFLEINENHGELVSDLALKSGFTRVEIHCDLAGRNRFARLVL